MPTIEVDKYICYAMGLPFQGYREAIYLFDRGGRAGAVLRFTNDTTPPPPGETNSGIYIVYYTREEYADVLDLLRNEKPIWFRWSAAGGLSYLRTGLEGVGEGEIEPFLE